MRPILPTLLAVAALASCSEPADGTREVSAAVSAPPPVAGAAPVAAAALGGVDLTAPLRVTGTEPFWGVTITPAAITYDGVDRPQRTGPNPGPALAGTTAVYSGALDGAGPYTLILTATECSDGMSDREYPLAARLQIGGETLTGCAASQAFFDASRP